MSHLEAGVRKALWRRFRRRMTVWKVSDTGSPRRIAANDTHDPVGYGLARGLVPALEVPVYC